MVYEVRRLFRPTLLALCIAGLLLIPASAAFSGGLQEAATPVSERAAVNNQAPSLAAMVERGELPPLEDRIPSNPRVIEPREGIGLYGGEFRDYMVGIGQVANILRIHGDGVLVWNETGTEVIPGVAESYSVNEDATVYTVTLREGLRWHDGMPYTTDDVRWWFENDAMNEEVRPGGPPGSFSTASGPAELEVVDEQTFRVLFQDPFPLWPQSVANVIPWNPVARHYGETIHGDFNPDAQRLAEEAGFELWRDRYGSLTGAWAAEWRNPDLPSVRAFTPAPGAAAEGDVRRVRMIRNPYYYKVDTEGNQLPYLDSHVYDVIEDGEVLLLRTLNGEFDFVKTTILNPDNRPILADGAERGDYRIVEFPSANTNSLVITLNMNHDDPVVREIANNREFRIGLSHAINRQEISDIVFAGMVEARQTAPTPGVPWYREQLENQYLEFSIETAHEYFEAAGYPVDAQGRVIGPDGNQITIRVDISAHDQLRLDMMELVQQQWQAAGVDVELNVQGRELWEQRRDSNQHEANTWGGIPGGRAALSDSRDYIPYHRESHFAPRWAVYWYTEMDGFGPTSILVDNGVRAEEPPPAVMRQFELWNEVQVSPTDRQNELMSEIMEIAEEEFFAIGLLEAPPQYRILHNRIGNGFDAFDGDLMPWSWQLATPSPMDTSQLYIRDEYFD